MRKMCVSFGVGKKNDVAERKDGSVVVVVVGMYMNSECYELWKICLGIVFNIISRISCISLLFKMHARVHKHTHINIYVSI